MQTNEQFRPDELRLWAVVLVVMSLDCSRRFWSDLGIANFIDTDVQMFAREFVHAQQSPCQPSIAPDETESHVLEFMDRVSDAKGDATLNKIKLWVNEQYDGKRQMFPWIRLFRILSGHWSTERVVPNSLGKDRVNELVSWVNSELGSGRELFSRIDAEETASKTAWDREVSLRCGPDWNAVDFIESFVEHHKASVVWNHIVNNWSQDEVALLLKWATRQSVVSNVHPVLEPEAVRKRFPSLRLNN